jgi:hypothetical protein
MLHRCDNQALILFACPNSDPTKWSGEQMALPTSPETSDRSFGALQVPLDQSSAFSLELQALTRPAPVTDQAAPRLQAAKNNASVENLPPLLIQGHAPHSDMATTPNPPADDHKLHGMGNVAINIGYAAAAITATEAVIGMSTKNPELLGMAAKSLEEGGVGMTLIQALTPAAAMGTAVAARHYTVGALGKPESWQNSVNQIGIGALEFVVGSKITSKFIAPYL